METSEKKRGATRMKATVGLFIAMLATGGVTAAPAAAHDTYAHDSAYSSTKSDAVYVVRIREVYRIKKKSGGYIVVYRVYYSDGTSRQVRVETG